MATGNVSLTCRYYGISRQCFYTWRRRYDAHGLDGLLDRSHRPQVSPNATRTASWFEGGWWPRAAAGPTPPSRRTAAPAGQGAGQDRR
jgi:hypothetical protein